MVFFLNVSVLQDSNIDDPKREVDSSMLQVRQTTLYLQQKSFDGQAKTYNQKKVGGAGLHLWSVIAVEGISLLQYCFLMKIFE